MSKYFILSEIQAEEIKKPYAFYNFSGGVKKALDPVKIKSGEFIINADLLSDSDYSEAFQILENCEIREVGEDEFITDLNPQ
jgi:hypothetical protein